MKKSFRKAGAAVLSMAMLLSMGAMAMPASAAALPTGSKITLKGAQGSYKLYQVASSSKDAGTGTTTYTIDSDFTSVLKIDGGYVATAAGAKLKDMADHGADIEAVAKALMNAAPKNADKDITIDSAATSADVAIGGDTGLGSGIYLIVGTANGKTQPILFDVVPSTTATIADLTVKFSEVEFIKEITAISNPNSEDDKIGKDTDGNNGGTGIA